MCRGRVLKRWVSRFDIYPYLEQFTVDAAHEINTHVGFSTHCTLSARFEDGFVPSVSSRLPL